MTSTDSPSLSQTIRARGCHMFLVILITFLNELCISVLMGELKKKTRHSLNLVHRNPKSYRLSSLTVIVIRIRVQVDFNDLTGYCPIPGMRLIRRMNLQLEIIHIPHHQLICHAPRPGLEPGTTRLTIVSSAN